MKKKETVILLVQFRANESFLHERLCMYKQFLGCNVHFVSVSAFDENVPWQKPKKILTGVRGVILGGSGELHLAPRSKYAYKHIHRRMMKNMRVFIRYLLRYDFPTLGICFGHQILGHMLGCRVNHDVEQAKTGTYLVSLLKQAREDPFFHGVRTRFLAQYGHMDSLNCVPNGAVLLAQGRKCKCACFRYKNNIYGTQFHPELTDADMTGRLRFSKEYIIGSEAETYQSICSSKQSERLLKNFVEYIIKK